MRRMEQSQQDASSCELDFTAVRLNHPSASTASIKSYAMNGSQDCNKGSDVAGTTNATFLQGIEVPNDFQNLCLKLLKCYSCPELVYPPIYSCRKGGHSFCHCCMTGRGSSCRICKSKFSKSRNKHLESIACFLKHRCSYTLCDALISGDEIDEHKAICEYRPVLCFEVEGKKCRGQCINFECFEKHLVDDHQTKVCNLNMNEFKFVQYWFHNFAADAARFPLILLKLDFNTFIFQIRKISQTEIGIGVSFLDGRDEAKKYRFTVQLEKPKASSFGSSIIQWTTDVFPVHTSVDWLLENGNICVISEKAGIPFAVSELSPGGKKQFLMTIGIRLESGSTA